MHNATLMYVINGKDGAKNLRLFSESLFNLDKYTCNYKNEDDFVRNYRNKAEIDKFVRENGRIGHIVVSYSKSTTERAQLLPLFNSKDIFIFKDDPYSGKETEMEKARKLLFNSKNQIFTKLIFSLKIFDIILFNLMPLTYKEAELLSKAGFNPLYLNNNYYAHYKTLFEYRIYNNKLSCIRRPYELMLDDIKERMMRLESNMFYYYNRQLRIAINMYNELVTSISVHNLNIKNFKMKKYKIVKCSL